MKPLSGGWAVLLRAIDLWAAVWERGQQEVTDCSTVLKNTEEELENRSCSEKKKRLIRD